MRIIIDTELSYEEGCYPPPPSPWTLFCGMWRRVGRVAAGRAARTVAL